MIKQANEMNTSIREFMRGGNGQVKITNVIEKEEMNGSSRLIATLTLEPGCSIGEHIHENEEEIFYVIEGTAEYCDNGTIVTLNKGDSCICKGGEKHSIANKTNETLVVFAIILNY